MKIISYVLIKLNIDPDTIARYQPDDLIRQGFGFNI